jgi:hypothetical protein
MIPYCHYASLFHLVMRYSSVSRKFSMSRYEGKSPWLQNIGKKMVIVHGSKSVPRNLLADMPA